jgi:hypothetical protein
MYDFPYNVMKPKYGVNIQSLMTDTDSFVYEIRTDTDSFVYEIKTEDFYADMKGIKENYDMTDAYACVLGQMRKEGKWA